MRKPLAIAIATVATAAVLAPATAFAGPGDTNATFTLNGNASGLSIAVPDGSTTPISLGTAATGAQTLSGSLGNTTVTDTRGALVAAWTVSASSTNFVTGGGTTQEKVTAANVAYYAGTGTAGSGQVGAFTPVGTALSPVAIGSSTPVGAWAGVGNNTVTWNPTLKFTLQAAQVAGTYAGTVTQSVS